MNHINKVTKENFSIKDFSTVINNSFDAVLVSDKHGKVLLCNAATGKLLGVDPQQIQGRNLKDIVKEGLLDRSVVLESIETCSVVSRILKNKNGYPIVATATPVLGKDDEIIMVVVNSRDVNILERYIKAFKQEQNRAVQYKRAVTYLGEKDIKQQEVVSKSKKMKEIVEKCTFIAKSDSTVLLLGESGTGKDVMARLIHINSNRADEPFIPVNCAAIPTELLESELFGYVSGAFTGANSQGKAGLFEIAHRGTLFLDEIGDLPLVMQSKLLRIIETGEVQRLGDTRITRTNVRLITATNRDLQVMVEKNEFRSDLYYRLNVIPIALPPLRERPDDIIALAERFLEEYNRKYSTEKIITPDGLQEMLGYSWPGNARELRNVIERLVITSKDNRLDRLDFVNANALINERKDGYDDNTTQPRPSFSDFSYTDTNRRYTGTLKSVLKKIEKEYIDQVLSECNGCIGETARRLGIHRTMLYRKMKEFQ